MTTIARINSSINDHTISANIIAAAILATITIISAAAINYAGQQVISTYEAATVPMSVTAQIPTGINDGSLTLGTVSSTSNIQGQTDSIVTTLQPTEGASYHADYSATSLQPSSSIQLTGTNPQNARGL